MDIVQKITGLVEPSLAAMGYALVQVKLDNAAKRKTLSLMAERADASPMGFDDCVEISRAVGALLEVDDPISGAYNLEVSSPGVDRPLTRPADFERFAGSEAKIETMIPIEGRKRFRGAIEGVGAGAVQLRVADTNTAVEIAFGNIRSAKLAPALMPASKKPQRKKHN